MGASREELVAITRAFNAAWNAHDLETIMAFFADDAILKVGPSPAPPGSEFATGKQQIRSRVRAELPGFCAETWDYLVSGDTVTFGFEYSNDFFRDEGVDSLEGTVEAVIERDRIKIWTVTFGPEAREKLEAALTQPP
jgi:hypothetical protein